VDWLVNQTAVRNGRGRFRATVENGRERFRATVENGRGRFRATVENGRGRFRATAEVGSEDRTKTFRDPYRTLADTTAQ
jgi:hypothetical protein